MAAPFNQRIVASSYHLCANDRKKMNALGIKPDIGELPVGGNRSVVSIADVEITALNTVFQIVQADEYREALLIYPPNDPTILKMVIGWQADVNELYDQVVPYQFPLYLCRYKQGGLVTSPIWAKYIG